MKRLVFLVVVLLCCTVPLTVYADDQPEQEPQDEVQAQASGPRYLVDGIQPSDLMPMQGGIFENLAEGRKFGLYVFAVMIALAVMLRIVKRFLHTGMAGDSRRDDMLR